MTELSWNNVITKFDRKPNPEFVKVMLDKVSSYYGTMNVRFEHCPEPYYDPDTGDRLEKRWMILCDKRPDAYSTTGQRLCDMVEGLKAGYNAGMTKSNCHI